MAHKRELFVGVLTGKSIRDTAKFLLSMMYDFPSKWRLTRIVELAIITSLRCTLTARKYYVYVEAEFLERKPPTTSYYQAGVALAVKL